MASDSPPLPPLGCDLKQLRKELADFQTSICKEVRQMFDRHEATMGQVSKRMSAHHTPAKPHKASLSSISGTADSAAPILLGHSDQVHVIEIMGGDPSPPGSMLEDEGEKRCHQYVNEHSLQLEKNVLDAQQACPSEPGTPGNGSKHDVDKAKDEAELECFAEVVHEKHHPQAHGVFGNLGTMDHYDLIEPVYHVTDFYKTEGFAQKIARSSNFENITLGVISANAIYLGIDTDRNKESFILDSHWAFQFCDHLFCTFFVAELVTRFAAFKWKRNCMRDGWFRFDTFLVALMVLETWVFPVVFSIIGGSVSLPTAPLRLLRLMRLSRLVRLIKNLPELLTMFKGMFVASRAVGASMLMVLLLLYVFGIIVHMGLSSEEGLEDMFGSLPRCMWTLLIKGTFMDDVGATLTDILDRGQVNTYLSTFIFLLFILLSATTVMNMLIGVLCEVVSKVAQSEQDEAAITAMKETILVELLQFDDDGNGMISKAELEKVMSSRQAIRTLRSIEVDTDCLETLKQMLFWNRPDDAEVHIERIMELLLNYRGSLHVTVKHLVDAQAFTRAFVTHQIKVQTEQMEGCLSELNSVTALMRSDSMDNLASGLRYATWPAEPPLMDDDVQLPGGIKDEDEAV